jgi:TolB-like protein/tetratricopeptide (TPR) repeat protein
VPSGTLTSVAVLPFKATGGDAADNLYLAEGISEELISRLARVPGLRVVPWMTAARYRQSTKSVRELADEMGVTSVLTGSLRRVGDQVRVTVALIDASTGLQSWGDEFDESVSDVFAMERRVAVGAATGLTGQLTPDQAATLGTASSRSAEAYELYLRGRVIIARDTASNALAGDLFSRALKLDPSLAEAHVGLGRTRLERYYYGWSGDLADLDRAESAHREAIRLDPRLAGAYEELATVWWLRGNSKRVLQVAREIRDAGLADPAGWLALANAYYFAGFTAEAVPIIRKVIEQDPGNATAYSRLVAALFFSGQYQEAIATKELAAQKGFGNARSTYYAGMSSAALGRRADAAKWFEAALEQTPDDFVVLFQFGLLQEQEGHASAARMTFQHIVTVLDRELARFPRNPRNRAWRAKANAKLGRREAALADEAAALAESGNNASILDTLGGARALLKDQQGAVRFFQEALDAGHVFFNWLSHATVAGLGDLEQYAPFREFVKALNVEKDRLRREYVR